MKHFLLLAGLCLINTILIGQDLKEIDTFIDQEKTYQSLFYLRLLKKTIPQTDFNGHFKINNRLIESFQLSKAPVDSIEPLLHFNSSLFSRTKDPYDRDYYLYVKGVQELISKQPEEAKKTFNRISGKYSKFKGNSNLKLGDLLQDQRKFAESIELFNKSLEAFRSDSLQFYFKIYRCHYLAGISYKNISKNKAAEIEYKTALLLLNLIPEPFPAERAKLLNNLANIFNAENEYTNAKTTYLEALTIKEKTVKDSLSIASTYSNLASFHIRFGNFSEAKRYSQKALLMMPTPRNASEQINQNALINNYCSLLREFGEFSKSKEVTKNALTSSSRFLEPGDISIIRLHLSTVEDAISLDEIDFASKTLEEVNTLLKEYDLNDPIHYDFEFALIDFLDKAELYDSCFRVSTKLIDHYNAIENTAVLQLYQATVKAGNSIGKLKPGTSIEYYKKAHQLAVSINQLPNILYTLNVQALEFLQVGELDSAFFYTKIVMSKNFLKDSSRIGSLMEFVDENIAIACFERLADIAFRKYKKGGQPDLLKQAEEQITLALQLIRKKRESLLLDADKFEFGDFVEEVFPQAADIYYYSYLVSNDPVYLDRMLYASELSKAQSLLLNLKKQGVETFAGITNSIYKRESELAFREKNLLHDMAFQFSLQDDFNPEVYEEQTRNLKTLEQEKSYYLDSIQKHLPGYYELKYDQTIVDRTTLLNELSSEALLLEYMGGHDNLYVIGLSKKQSFILPISSSLQLEKPISLLRNHLKFKYDQELLEDERTLYKYVMSQTDSLVAAKQIKVSTLIIIPDASLTLLPFELLVDHVSKQGAPHYLIERYPIYYNYSATLFWQKTTDPRVSLSKGMVNFAPKFNSPGKNITGSLREEMHENFQFDELVETGNEVASIAEVYKKKMKSSSRIYDQQAGEANFKLIKFDQLSFVHLATHGFAGSNGPKSSGLAFKRSFDKAEDDILYAEEVYNLRMPVELVTLSACETGLGKYYSGEGLVGLARAFFYAGARSVIVSLWKVQDKSTSELMRNFYSEYFSPLPNKAEALRNAKIKMIHSKEFKHPFYWSPFILLGAN